LALAFLALALRAGLRFAAIFFFRAGARFAPRPLAFTARFLALRFLAMIASGLFR
jgi:hypothetical protein